MPRLIRKERGKARARQMPRQAGGNGRRQTMAQARMTAGLNKIRSLRRLAGGVVLAVLLGAPVLAQSSPFSPALFVNERVISNYELEQRILFMTLLRQPGDIEQMALDSLIDDRLRLYDAAQLGIKSTPEAIEAGMAEFASRANLSTEEFLKAIAQGGVDPQSFRDFVEAGMIWREVIRARYAPVTSITDAEVDRAMAEYMPESVPTIRYAEIVLPGTGAQRSASLALARRLAQQIVEEADFYAAARKYSKGSTAGSGGSRDWQRLTSFDDKTRVALLRTQPGRVSEVVQSDENITLYMVLDRAEEALSAAEMAVLVEYAEFLIPDGPTALDEAARIRRSVDTCDELYDVAKGLPADRLKRETRAPGAVPADIAGALTLLDTGESSASVTRGGWRVFLMVCRRGVDKALMPSREDARAQLMNQRLAAQADIYLEELRSEAIIRQP